MPRTHVKKFIVSEIRNCLSVVTFNRPSQMNALTIPMIDEVLQDLTSWEKFGSSVGSVIIKGAGPKSFCSGGDIKCLALAARDRNLEHIRLQTEVGFKWKSYKTITYRLVVTQVEKKSENM